MSGVMDMVTGKSAKRAARASELARQQQSVEQARQLQTLNLSTAENSPTRRAPRGRRLLADAAVSNLPATVA